MYYYNNNTNDNDEYEIKDKSYNWLKKKDKCYNIAYNYNWRIKKDKCNEIKYNELQSKKQEIYKKLVLKCISEKKLYPLLGNLINEHNACEGYFEVLFNKCWSYVGFNKDYFYILLKYFIKKRETRKYCHECTHSISRLNDCHGGKNLFKRYCSQLCHLHNCEYRINHSITRLTDYKVIQRQIELYKVAFKEIEKEIKCMEDKISHEQKQNNRYTIMKKK